MEEFLSHFDLCVLANGWSEKEAGTFLGISLAGIARRLLSLVTPSSAEGYKSLRAALVNRFQPTSQVESYKALLRTRTRKQGEELQNLAEEIGRLVRLSFPNADAGTVDTISKDRFVDCLDDVELRHWIYQGEPKDLAAAVQRGVQAEAYLKTERAKTQRVRGTNMTMAEEMESLKGQMGSWMKDISRQLEGQTKRPVDAAPEKKRCYECGSEAHFKRSCAAWQARMAKAGKTEATKAAPSEN